MCQWDRMAREIAAEQDKPLRAGFMMNFQGDWVRLELFCKYKTEAARIAAGRYNAGSPTWARTRDLRINSPALYQLSYRGTEERIIGVEPARVKPFVDF